MNENCTMSELMKLNVELDAVDWRLLDLLQADAGLDEFIAIVSGKRSRDSVRLTTITWNGQVEVLTLRLDDTYWPSYQIVWHDDQWRREALLR